MSNLRIIGLLIGSLGIFLTFFVYRGRRWKRANFLFFTTFNMLLILICIEPDSINFVAEVLSLEDNQHGRVIGLLIFSVLFLFLITFYTKSRVELLRLQVDRLVRSLGVRHLNIEEVNQDRIRPIMVLIPAFNEADNLKVLLKKIPQYVNNHPIGVLIVDDGSEDATCSVSKNAGAVVLRNPINRGGGAALRLGYDILKQLQTRICITMDADCQHDPAEIEKLVTPILQDRYDVVIGSRILGSQEKGSLLRLIGVYLFGAFVSFMLGKRITDPSSGFRAFKVEILRRINLYEDQYHTSELIVEAIRKGYRIGEIPIRIAKRLHGESKKGKDWIYGFHFAKTIIKTWWRPR